MSKLSEYRESLIVKKEKEEEENRKKANKRINEVNKRIREQNIKIPNKNTQRHDPDYDIYGIEEEDEER